MWCREEQRAQFFRAAGKAVEHDAWAGKLLLGNGERGLFSAHARLTLWGGQDLQVVRAALISVDPRRSRGGRRPGGPPTGRIAPGPWRTCTPPAARKWTALCSHISR